MYYALNQDINNLETYHSFIIEILENDTDYYKSIFKQIVQQAQELAKSQNFYSVDSERFGIISFLAKHEDVIRGLNPDDLKEEDFVNLRDCLEMEYHS